MKEREENQRLHTRRTSSPFASSSKSQASVELLPYKHKREQGLNFDHTKNEVLTKGEEGGTEKVEKERSSCAKQMNSHIRHSL